ncbi:MAG TPA: hypothetical protein K8V56_21375 [Sporosarcina psychrophila]|uniref:Uncharacterized protein n=1 Tax=Sporosarcina psychrophila TaxID=1476 RepID=A0A921G2R6_SPOPS|nr:hypothetical protein [Sporosarcina psychrophila]
MHWMMWIFWGSIVTLLVGSYVVDFLTGRKYDFKEKKKSLNQNSASADSLREIGRHDQQNGPF